MFLKLEFLNNALLTQTSSTLMPAKDHTYMGKTCGAQGVAG
jgi:hypothetical protein